MSESPKSFFIISGAPLYSYLISVSPICSYYSYLGHHYAISHIWGTKILLSHIWGPFYSYFSHIWVAIMLFLIFPPSLLSYFSYLAAITLIFLIFGLLFLISGPPFALFTYQDRLKLEARHLWGWLRRPFPSWLAPTKLARLHLGWIKQASLVSLLGQFRPSSVFVSTPVFVARLVRAWRQKHANRAPPKIKPPSQARSWTTKPRLYLQLAGWCRIYYH